MGLEIGALAEYGSDYNQVRSYENDDQVEHRFHERIFAPEKNEDKFAKITSSGLPRSALDARVEDVFMNEFSEQRVMIGAETKGQVYLEMELGPGGKVKGGAEIEVKNKKGDQVKIKVEKEEGEDAKVKAALVKEIKKEEKSKKKH
jgi:hypothetical protein